MNRKKVSLIIPTYNEADNIGEILSKVTQFVDDILIIDDNSEDGTAEIAKKFDKNVRVIIRPRKMGLNSAIYLGALNAKYKYIAVMDGDLSHPPETLKEMLKYVPKYDIIIGTRYDAKNWSLTRNFISFSAKVLAIPFTGKIRDPISGFFVMKKDLLLKYGRFAPPEGYKILLTVLIHYLRKEGCYKKIKEVYYIFNNRKRGKSKLGKKQILLYVYNIISNAFRIN
ncbi:MAG: glycosyltransferase [Candidatus Asgardarchaeia archaeon]